MAFAKNGAVRLHWREDGAGLPLLLLNSVGCNLSLWDAVIPYLSGFRVVRMDMRGHGQSDSPPGDYTLDQIAADAMAVLDAAGIEKAAVCGLSFGGMAAMTLTLNAPERVFALVLACTSAKMDPAGWDARIQTVRSQGMAAVADAVMARFFSEHFRRDHAVEVDIVRSHFLSLDPQGYSASCAAIRDMALLDKISVIQKPTLVIAGNEDVATPYAAHGAEIQTRIVGSRSRMLDAAHIVALETPTAFAMTITEFLYGIWSPVFGGGDALYRAGLGVRRQILGDAWVDKSLNARTPFTADFQNMITRNVWNEIWNRPGLDHKTRRLLTVAMTASLGAWEEFRLHVRSGLEQNGFNQDELKEVLLQVAAYAGVPRANTAFAEAGEIVQEMTRLTSLGGRA